MHKRGCLRLCSALQIVLSMMAMALVMVLGHRIESVSSAGAALYVTGKWLLLLDDAGLFNVGATRVIPVLCEQSVFLS